MNVREILEAKNKTEPVKPRNFVAKNAINTGAGAHKDKKKAAKQGDVKHKSKVMAEGAMDELHADLSDKYNELAPSIKKYKDEDGADRLYDELKAIANEHNAGREFRRMCDSAQHRAHMDYDTNPGHFKNWFWYLPFANDDQGIGEAGYRDRRDSYQRDYDHSTAGMGKRQSYAYQQDGGANDEGDDDSFLRAQQEKEQGPWYLKVNGKILTSQGQPKVFDMKKGANNYALAILKNKPELQGKIFLTKRADNDVSESATAGATAAANVSVGPVYKNKSAKTPKNKDGTAKNAVDIKGANLITGGSLVKR
jgi:hypothetical protein